MQATDCFSAQVKPLFKNIGQRKIIFKFINDLNIKLDNQGNFTLVWTSYGLALEKATDTNVSPFAYILFSLVNNKVTVIWLLVNVLQ